MKRILFVLLITLILFTSCNKPEEINTAEEKKETIVPIEVLEIKTEQFIEYGEYYGKTSGIKEAQLVSISGGRVESVSVKEGRSVVKGASLGSIDSNKIINQYETAKLSEKIAKENYERQQKFIQTGNTSQVALDKATLEWYNSRTSLEDAKRIYKGNLCISPIDGIVVSRMIDPYQEIPAGTLTFIVSDLRTIKISFGIPENDMAGIKENNKAEVTFDNFPERKWSGKLVRLSRKSSDLNLLFQGQVNINNSDLKILSGSTAKVKLVRKIHYNKIVLPTNMIQNSGTQNYVMIYENGVVKQYFVKTGPSNDTKTLILSGVKNGQGLISKGFNIVKEGSLVKIIGEKEKAND